MNTIVMLVKGSSTMKLGKVKKHVLNSKLNQEKMACFAYILRVLGLMLFIYSSSLLAIERFFFFFFER